MGDAKSIKERGILEQVIKSELDFITYVDVHTRNISCDRDQ